VALIVALSPPNRLRAIRSKTPKPTESDGALDEVLHLFFARLADIERPHTRGADRGAVAAEPAQGDQE